MIIGGIGTDMRVCGRLKIVVQLGSLGEAETVGRAGVDAIILQGIEADDVVSEIVREAERVRR